MPVNYEHHRKQRNDLLKMKAKAFTGRRAIYDADDNEGGTFVTGVGIPGRREATDDQNEEGDNKEEYKYY